MPKRSKHIAVRQAELSKKKKRVGPRPAEVYRDPLPAPEGLGPDRNAPASPPPERPPQEGALPSLALPRVAPAITSSRRELPPSPYLKSDLRRIAVLSAGMLAILTILALVLR